MKRKRRARGATPIVVDLFAGMGGMSAGLRDAGFRIAAAVEIDEDARLTYSANHGGVPLLGDIRAVSAKKIKSAAGVRVVDVVVGCPPCQGFTRLTENSGRRDPRNRLVMEFLRVVQELKPRVCMMENVPGLATRGRGLFGRLLRGLRAAGYRVAWDVVEMADYGVPQMRKRLVLMAGRGFDVAIPRPTHRGAKRWRSVRDAIGMLPSPPTRSCVLSGKRKETIPWHFSRDISKAVRERLVHARKHGGSRFSLPKKLRLACHEDYDKDGFGDVYGVLSWDAPSRTVTGGCTNPSKGRFGHPREPRPLTCREAAMLQTLGRRYKLRGKGSESVALQIGNALPRRFAKVAGRQILRALTSQPA
jgi:DNA (cytosine-5)-methyltransferase 1